MRPLVAALIVTFAIAVTASVFAIWPVVADAPWEEDTTAPVVEDRRYEIRCEGALRFRITIIEAGRFEREIFEGAGHNLDGVVNYEFQLANAEREIIRYC